jgi:hypothetical protein
MKRAMCGTSPRVARRIMHRSSEHGLGKTSALSGRSAAAHRQTERSQPSHHHVAPEANPIHGGARPGGDDWDATADEEHGGLLDGEHLAVRGEPQASSVARGQQLGIAELPPSPVAESSLAQLPQLEPF